MQENYNAEDISSSPIRKQDSLKIKFMFKVMDRDLAYKLYNTVHKMKIFPETNSTIQIYYLKSETIFMKYADEEAAHYYAEQEKIAAER